MHYSEVIRRCLTCGQLLVLKNSRDVERKRFCSRACNAKANEKLHSPEHRRRISEAVKASWADGSRTPLAGSQHPRWQGGEVERQCVWCRKPFKTPAYKLRDGNGKYCSRQCYLQHHAAGGHKKPLVEITCQVCGKPRKVHPHLAKTAKHCSRRCSAVRASQVMATRTEGTWIEQAIERILTALGASFTKQAAIGGITTADFLVGDKLAIYADGDYWHSLPRTKSRDAFITRRLTSWGYTVLRIRESTIAESENTVRDLIAGAINARREC